MNIFSLYQLFVGEFAVFLKELIEHVCIETISLWLAYRDNPKVFNRLIW